MTPDRLAARLRATFLAELEEQTGVMNADLLVLEREPANAERLQSLFRVAHTLKGAARAANVPVVEQACHALESLLAKARDRKLTLDPAAFALLFAAADALADARRRLAEDGDLAGTPLADVMRALTEGRPLQRRAQPAAAVPPVEAPAPDRQQTSTQIRIDAGALDAVLAAAADLRQARGRVSADATKLSSIDELTHATMARWRSAARQIRARLAPADDAARELRLIDDLDDRFRALARETSQAASTAARDVRTLGHAVDEVVGGAVRLRMRPFAEVCEALPRMVRDLAAEEHKDVRLTIQGGSVEADRSVLDVLREPIVHLVRNAISHGVEEPARRAAAGKPSHASLTISAALHGDRFIATVADDGGGIDAAALRPLLERAGREVPAGDAALARALFVGGISTRAQPSVISGRGVGLELVRTAVERIGGAVNVEWRPGRGSTFTLDCPLTLASIRVVLVAVGAHTVAIPTASVERLLRVHSGTIARAEGRDVLPGPDGPVPVVSLARVLGAPYAEHAVAPISPVVQMLAGGRRLAAVVDALIDECEITVRPLDHRRPLPLLSGAAIITTAGASGVAPVLNAAAIIAESDRVMAAGGPSLRVTPDEAVSRRRILVVDDSITTRTLEQSVLETAGYEVLTAVDGSDGWRVLQEQPCDLVVSDVEMPRMDGFALCAAIRASPRFAKLPVVLVTALESAEQRARGLEAGADAYLGKSSFDQQTLLDVVRQFLE